MKLCCHFSGNMGLQTGRSRSVRWNTQEFKVQKITAAELVQGEILGQTDSQMRKNFSKNGTAEKFNDEEIHEILTERFAFCYPLEYH